MKDGLERLGRLLAATVMGTAVLSLMLTVLAFFLGVLWIIKVLLVQLFS